MKIKKISAWNLAGTLTFTAPALAYAGTEDSETILFENQIDSLLDNPDQVADILIYVKETIDQQNISDDQILEAIHLAEDNLGIDLSEKEEESVLRIAKKIQDMDVDEEELREQVTRVYEKMDELGIGKEEVKGFLEKAVDFVKGLLGE